ncbi:MULTISPECIES: DUF1877 family protein [Streptomyces]|uniref:DUF1877 family protein n=1 Tax=Streptomyces solicathayae TaxID=3081768 RepID=A0ABZ0LL94_9ACTN|nr:DUF1877 family protein [Streptomyces sp. HUAS YS2]WOX20199.1 DUF1877 family protein [Streptomyces sp. HUAS YS2]
MSFHMHLRAVPAGEVRADAVWLETFMRDAWDAHAVESAAGVSTSIEKDFGVVGQLHSAAVSLDESDGGSCELAVYGGRVVDVLGGRRPPFVLLGPEEVREAAAFLDRADFDALWAMMGARLAGPGSGTDEDELRQHIRGHHVRLQGFYRRAAAAGYEVVKAFWY